MAGRVPLKVTSASCWKDSPLRRFTVCGSEPSVELATTRTALAADAVHSKTATSE